MLQKKKLLRKFKTNITQIFEMNYKVNSNEYFKKIKVQKMVIVEDIRMLQRYYYF